METHIGATGKRLSEPEGSDRSGHFRGSVLLSNSPSGSLFIRSAFTPEQDDPARVSIQGKGPFTSLVCDSQSPKEKEISDESTEANHETGGPRFSEKNCPRELQSDPFDDAAVLDSVAKDDLEERTISFRSILIGLITSALGACIAEVFMFKPVKIQVDILFLQVICLCLGHAFASIPGPMWWNPGPINMKETAFSLIMAASASTGVYGVEVIAAQEVVFGKKMPAIVSVMTLLSTQLIGYGVAGILRPLLVYPSKIVFPGVLPVVALFHSMSTQSKTTKDQMSTFKKTFAAISLYEILPTYIAPAFSAVSIWCLALPKVPAITNLFGGSLPGEGMGLMAFSADWTLVGSHSPLYVPLMAQITDWISYFCSIIIFSWAYTADYFGGGKLPFISYNLLDKNGKKYNLNAAMHKNGTRNSTAIEHLGLPSFTTSFVLAKAFISMAATASITIAVCSSIMSLSEARKQEKLGKISKPCPHREVTKHLRDFPTYGFVAIFIGAVVLAFLASHFADSGLSPQALLVALLVSSILCLASGYFTGTLGMVLLVTPPVQAIGGLLFPGNAVGNMWFTMYGASSAYQCVHMLKDLKLGLYMHLAPFAVVTAQLIGTIFGGLAHVLVMISIVTSQHDVLLMPHGNGIFTGMMLSLMTSSSTSWGLFSHELFYPGKIYAIVTYCLIAGFFVPIPFLILRWYHPNSVLSKFNISLFIANLSHGLTVANSGRFTAVFVGLLSQFYMRKYQFRWYKKYNYIICAALDGGTQITVVIMAFLFQGGAGFQVKMPTYFLNPEGPRDYCKMAS